jgi:hypothetical protein
VSRLHALLIVYVRCLLQWLKFAKKIARRSRYPPISTRRVSMIACSRSISPSGVLGLEAAGGEVVAGRSVAIRDNTVNDSRRDVKRAVSLSLEAVGGCKGNSVVCVNAVGCHNIKSARTINE